MTLALSSGGRSPQRSGEIASITPIDATNAIASPDVERSLLASILRYPDQFEVAHDVLTSRNRPEICDFEAHECFFDRAYGWVYQALSAAYDSHRQASPAIAVDWMRNTDNNRFEKLGGRTWLRDIYLEGFASNTIAALAQQILDCAIRRSIQSHLTQVIAAANDSAVPIETLNETIAKIPHNLSYSRDGSAIAQSASDIIAEMDAEMESFHKHGKAENRLIPTGFYDLDNHLGGGIEQGQCVVTAARPSMGKTSFVLAIASNMAQRGIPTLILTAEQSPRQLIEQIAAQRSRIPTKEFFTPDLRANLDDVQQRSLRQAFIDIAEQPLTIRHVAWYSEIRLEIQRWASMNHAQGLPPGVVFLDYIQNLNDVHQSDNGNAHVVISRIVKGLATLGVEINTSMWLLSQLNRSVESRTNKRPVLGDLRESGSIEEAARLLMFLYRDSYYNPDNQFGDRGDLDTTEVIVAKGSRCGTTTINLNWHKEFAGFSNRAT